MVNIFECHRTKLVRLTYTVILQWQFFFDVSYVWGFDYCERFHCLAVCTTEGLLLSCPHAFRETTSQRVQPLQLFHHLFLITIIINTEISLGLGALDWK